MFLALIPVGLACGWQKNETKGKWKTKRERKGAPFQGKGSHSRGIYYGTVPNESIVLMRHISCAPRTRNVTNASNIRFDDYLSHKATDAPSYLFFSGRNATNVWFCRPLHAPGENVRSDQTSYRKWKFATKHPTENENWEQSTIFTCAHPLKHTVELHEVLQKDSCRCTKRHYTQQRVYCPQFVWCDGCRGGERALCSFLLVRPVELKWISSCSHHEL